MKSFVVVLALAIAALVNVAQAAPGDKGFCYGTSGPEHLAKLVEASLAQDLRGTTKLNCPIAEGSRATPLHYFNSLNESLKKAGFKKRIRDVRDVPAFIRGLKVIQRPQGKYEVSCLRPSGGGGDNLVMDCLEREFESNEDAWATSETQGDYEIDLVLMTSNCANVVNRKVVLKITIIGGTPETTIAPPFATKGCPDGFTVFFHVWSCQSLPTKLCEQARTLIQLAEARNGEKGTNLNAYRPSAVSRTLYEPLSYEPEAKVDESITVQFLDPQTLKVEGETQNVAVVAGIGKMQVTEAQLSLVRKSTWPSDYISPMASCGASGDEKCLMNFSYEWMNKKGGRYCAVHEVGLLK